MRLLFYSNIYVAAAAVALTVQTGYCVAGAQKPGWALLALVFSGTLFVYNLDRLVSASSEDTVDVTGRHRWIRAHRRSLWALCGAAGLAALVSLFFVPVRVLWGLLPLGAVSLAYSLPVLGGGERRRRLKDVPGLKIVLIATVWACVTVLLPALEADLVGRSSRWIWVLVERFIFIFAITLPFDVRDVERDRQAGIVTVPMRLGAGRTRWLAVALSIVFVGWALATYGPSWQEPTPALVVSGLISAAALYPSDRRRDELYYVGLLDGLMILQATLVVGYMSSIT